MTEREEYTNRLVHRLNEVLVRDGIKITDWEEISLPDRVLLEALFAYEDGEIDREELNSKAVGYLHEIRRAAQ